MVNRKRLCDLWPAYKRKVRAMEFVYYAAPIMVPIECQPQPPLVFYPVKNIKFRFPIPVQYAPPPVAIL